MSTATVTDFGVRGSEILKLRKESDREAWATTWKAPTYGLGKPEDCWTHFTLTTVADFNAELGFWVDAIGLDVFMLQQPSNDEPDAIVMGMVAAPDESFIIGFQAEDATSTAAPANSISYEFMVQDLDAAWAHIVAAGGQVEKEPWDVGWGVRATAKTPNGFEVRLWSIKKR